MWQRRVSRSRGAPYLVHVATGETRWCAPPGPVAKAYSAVVPRSGDDPEADAARRANNAWKRELVSAAVEPGSRVLDVCCGRGGDLAKCAHAGARAYVGVDVAPGCIAEARDRFAAARPPVSDMACTFQVADVGVERLPVDDGSVDAAISMFALHYLADDPVRMGTALGEVSRALRPGGTFVCTVPDPDAVARFAAGDAPPYMRVSAPRALPDLETRHAHPWNHPYTFEYVGRTPPLTEFLVHVPALEAVAGDLVLERRVPGPALYVALVFRKPLTCPPSSSS